MELRHLRYFLAAAETGNFRRAADQLHITQPPLSRAIRQLEEELGHSLFDRSSNGVRLTTAGEQLRVEARRLVDNSDALIQRFNSMHKARDGVLDVAYVGAIVATTVPQAIRAFRDTTYDVSINLHSMDKVEQVRALAAGTIDVGIGRSFPESPSISTETILEESLLAAVPVLDPRSQLESLSLEDICADTLICFPAAPRPSFPDTVFALFQAEGLQLAEPVIVDDILSCLGLVSPVKRQRALGHQWHSG